MQLPEQSYSVRKDVFGVLAKLKKGPMEVWFLLMKLMECQEQWSNLPTKLHVDARVLVERGIVLEDSARPGVFRVNPEIAYVSSESTLSELLRDEADS